MQAKETPNDRLERDQTHVDLSDATRQLHVPTGVKEDIQANESNKSAYTAEEEALVDLGRIAHPYAPMGEASPIPA